MTREAIVAIIVGFVLFSAAFYLFSVVLASYLVYTKTLMRKSKEQWGRTVSSNDELALKMDDEGMVWQREHNSYRHDVHIVRDGANLYGEY